MPGFRQLGKGTFQVDVDGCFHCGPDHSTPKAFDYEVEVHYPKSALDEHGFLLDNLEFKAYFENLQRVSDSCELLAKRAAEFFWERASGRCKWLRVAVWGIKNGACIEYILDCDPKEDN